MKRDKLFKKVLSGSKNVQFSEIKKFAEMFGFNLDRVNGSHHIFKHSNIPELINLQNVHGKAKPYQIKQLLEVIERHNLNMEDKD